MRRTTNMISCTAIVALSIGLTGTAQAQEATPPDTGAQDIIVTAQKRDEALQDVPIAITAFGAQQLEQAGVSDVMDLAKVTPSLLITEGSSQAQPFIRGVGGRNITPGNEATTAVYIDGVYQVDKTGLLLQSFPDVQSVQVLRGPQGTLFGRNATSGAILVTTKAPSQDAGLMLEGTYGTDEAGARGFGTIGIAPNLALGVSGFYRDEFAYLRNMNPANGLDKKVGEEESWGFRGSLRWDASDNISATLQGYYSEGYTDALMAVQPVKGAPLTVGDAVASAFLGINIREPDRAYYGEIDPEVRFDGWGGSLTLDADLGSVAIKSISAYGESGSGVQLDLDGSPIPVFWFDTNLKSRTYQQEIDLTSQTDSPFQWIAGAFYINYRDGYTQLDQNVGLPVPSPLQPHTVPDALIAAAAAGAAPGSAVYIDQNSFVTVESLGLFGEASYEFTPATKLTLGLRYTTETHTLDDDNMATTYTPDGAGGLLTIPTTVTAACDATPECDGLDTSFNKLTYRAVLDHKFSDDFMAYASLNRGFKSGVYNISTVTNVIATEPETIDAYEIGFKSSLLDRRLTLNASAYYYKYDNLQVPVVDPATNTQRSINAAKATISGIELETVWRPSERFNVAANFAAFFESKYDSFPNCEISRPNPAGGNIIVPNADCSGRDLPATPDFSLSISPSYTLPLANDSKITFAGLFSYIDEFDHASWGSYPAGPDYPAGIGRAPIQKSIETLNLSITFTAPDEAFYVSVWGKDLFDSNDIYRNLFTTPFGYYTSLTRGITGGLTVGTKFGSQR